MSLDQEYKYRQTQLETRRHFLKQCTTGLGSLALAGLGCASPATNQVISTLTGQKELLSHYFGRAKRVIYLHMAGSPSQLELFDYTH
jgi:hypothetical protein